MRLGILGGSFNPVHTGHVRMAVEAREALGLARVDLVPAAAPPHKPGPGLLPFGLRLRLAELAVHGIPGLAASGVEGELPPPSYTWRTLEEYARREPWAELFFILGSGTLLDLPDWKRGPDLFGLAHFAALHRWDMDLEGVERMLTAHWPGVRREAPALWRFPSGKTLSCLEMPRLDIKAADLRVRWRERRSLALLVPPAVEEALERGGAEYEAAWGPRRPL
ncbi:MAG TPA: nicotinate-nicotinamide nucleotide adenylyltransferase [Desulfovibrio sp.]|uniref:nicotinate-nicotinamide nucleotide adenylyltransferase n=1 Tax=Desulfovibrio TaxID=872 RepID=UPI002C5B0364|nr:nicotinate-nicotinamide nucleotide adenylyltransferase [Desulfovibrio sp.]HMM39060.1 nicotinate-nicotinamide nucleotide adenylyltransferase [Desulfovibrio sp.]